MLNATDVVVVAYNPQHTTKASAGRRPLAPWREMLDTLLPRLRSFAATPGKAAFIREPGAQHFALGAYRPEDEYRLASCKPLAQACTSSAPHR